MFEFHYFVIRVASTPMKNMRIEANLAFKSLNNVLLTIKDCKDQFYEADFFTIDEIRFARPHEINTDSPENLVKSEVEEVMVAMLKENGTYMNDSQNAKLVELAQELRLYKLQVNLHELTQNYS